MGIPAAVILKATTASALEKVIADSSNSSKLRKKGAVKKVGRKAVAKKKTTTTRTSAKASPRKASAPAKSRTSGKAKRPSNSTSTAKGGRNTLDSVDFSQTEGWNPRDGSAPDRIIKALKRFRGNRTKVFDHLRPDIADFVSAKKANGEKHTKASREAMLRYRISRTAWDFAMRTGQHEASSNRVEYGTGGTGNGTFKPAKRKPAQKRFTAPKRKAAAKTTRKPATRQKAAGGRRTPAKRGRPKAGSRR
jgi:hypothetical protein